MRRFPFAALILALSASPVLAATTPPLEPGKPAGVDKAQLQNGTAMIVVAGAALVGIGIALATASDGASGPPTTTATTSTTP